MALTCTVFEVASEITRDEAAEKLRRYSVSLGELEFLDRKVAIGMSARDIMETPNGVAGVLEEILPVSVEVEGALTRIPVRLMHSFRIVWRGGACYALIFAKRKRALRLADSISYALFGEGGRLIGTYLPSEKLRRLSSEEGARIKQVVLKGFEGEKIGTVVVYGRDLQLRELKKRFAGSFEVFVVYEDDVGVFGVGSHGYIIAFSNISEEEFEEYLVSRVIPLLEPPPAH